MTPYKNLKNNLLKIGLSEKESIVYLACLSETQNTPTSLKRHVALPRSTIYNILASLLEKGFIYEKVINKRTYYHTVDVTKAMRTYSLFKEQELCELQEVINEIQLKLKNIQELDNRKIAGEMRTYEGKESLLQISKELLSNNENIYWFGSSEMLISVSKAHNNRLRKAFSFKRLDKSMKDHGILTDQIPSSIYYKIPEIGEYKMLENSCKHSSVIAASGDLFIILQKNKERLKLYTIEDSDIASLFRTMFKDYWKKMD